MRDQVMAVVRANFRPEFLNRVDDIILFHRLEARADGGDRRHPARPAAEAPRRAQDHARQLDKSARKWLAEKGYDPAYGARPLKRVIQRELQDPLAEKILAGDVRDGDEVKITAGSDRLLFRPKHEAEKTEAEAA